MRQQIHNYRWTAWAVLTAFALLPALRCHAVFYQRFVEGRSEGGVINDIAYDAANEIIYVASMENSMFHLQDTNSDNEWTDEEWGEHLWARQCYGVDAYHTGTGAAEKDYIIVACEFDGIFRGTYNSVTGAWSWPNADKIELEPPYWSMAHWEDATFWGNSDEGQFFATGFEVDPQETPVSKLWRWNASGPAWVEVNQSTGLEVAKFYRDLSDNTGKTLYGIGPDGIWKKTGDTYTADWNDAENDFTTEDILEVTGFYQDRIDNTKYILARYNTTGLEYRIYREGGTQLATITTLDDEDTDVPIGPAYLDDKAVGLVVQEYDGAQGTEYRIWIGSGAYGLLFTDTGVSADWTQLSDPDEANVSGWHPRTLMRDPYDTDNEVHIFYLTWQAGMYYYDPNAQDIWKPMKAGLIGGRGSGYGADL
ncbi:MAG TPA: hypothetical protein VF398_07170 [bacterium]|jgi:hypothetical protein